MKKTILTVALATLASVALAADVEKTTTTTTEGGGSSTTVKTTTSSGTVTEYAPGKTFIVKESSGPVTYHYGDKVTYVTGRGKTISDDEARTRIKAGAPVHVLSPPQGSAPITSGVEPDD